MSNQNSGATLIKTGAELTFPEYQPKKTPLQRFLRLNTKRHQALAKVESIVRQSAVHNYDRKISTFHDDGDTDRLLHRANLYERMAHDEYTRLMGILDGLETGTLAFIAETYGGTVTSSYSDLITSALAPIYLKDVEASGEDINLIVKNVISYRNRTMNWSARNIKAFNDVRIAPELNRPDLYSLTGEDREWVMRIFKVSVYSRFSAEGPDIEGMPANNSSHMNPELALLLREGDEWVYRVTEFISQRRMWANEITPDLVRGIHTTGAEVLNDGML